MSDTQSNTGNENGGGGCLITLLVLVMLAFGLIAMAGGDSTSTTTTTNTTPILSGNEMFSRNQANVFSDVVNNYLDCMGAFSCVVTDASTVVTTTTTSVSNSDTTVSGERNVIYAANGAMMCPNPDNPNEWGDRADWCSAAGVLP